MERNLKTQAEQEALMNRSPKSEPEEFELRKNPLESNLNSPIYGSSPSHVPMPRAVLLSNPQLHQSQLSTKPKLYDEDDMNSQCSEGIGNNEPDQNLISELNDERSYLSSVAY